MKLAAHCDHITDKVEEVRLDDRLIDRFRFVTMELDVDLDDLVPFYLHNTQVKWIGAEQALGEVAIENPEDIESRYAPGYRDPSDSIEIEFLSDAVALEKVGNVRGALAIIYRRVDEMLKLDMLQFLDEELLSVPSEEIGTDVLLGLLTATLPAKSRLPSRPALFKATNKLLKSRGHYERGILDGLQ